MPERPPQSDGSERPHSSGTSTTFVPSEPGLG